MDSEKMEPQINADERRLNALSKYNTRTDFQTDATGIDIAASRGLDWLKEQEPKTVKDISRSVQALSLWDEPSSYLIKNLLSLKKDGFWDTQTPLLDTARACIALSGIGKIQPETIRWIEQEQQNDNWNNSEIDTAYALMALGDCRIMNPSGCEWLFRNYGKKWEHAGTTSLIIIALIKQDKNKYRDFINERTLWLLSKREAGGWNHIATSNLVIQALVLAGIKEQDIAPSIKWLIEKQENSGGWKDITSTALSLISLKMYLGKFNSGSDK